MKRSKVLKSTDGLKNKARIIERNCWERSIKSDWRRKISSCENRKMNIGSHLVETPFLNLRTAKPSLKSLTNRVCLFSFPLRAIGSGRERKGHLSVILILSYHLVRGLKPTTGNIELLRSSGGCALHLLPYIILLPHPAVSGRLPE